MDITFSGRDISISDRFRDFVTEKSERITHIDSLTEKLEVRISRHIDRNGNHGDDHVELTLRGHGPVIRAESGAGDKYAAFDVAIDKLIERVRRAKDRRKIHRGGGHHMMGLSEATQPIFLDEVAAELELDDNEAPSTPIVIRSKEFPATHMSAADAVDHMELVGHPFFLFIDSETGLPSVVYRRKGWTYGVIALRDA
ncbi:MAG: ribosome-associated translation inhibitor RaiA [Actinomycetota bacterium]|jgi:ribosomal subunit interface protein